VKLQLYNSQAVEWLIWGELTLKFSPGVNLSQVMQISAGDPKRPIWPHFSPATRARVVVRSAILQASLQQVAGSAVAPPKQ